MKDEKTENPYVIFSRLNDKQKADLIEAVKSIVVCNPDQSIHIKQTAVDLAEVILLLS